MEEKRIHLMDELRGLAVLCMVFHHALLSIGDIFRSQFFINAFNSLHILQPIFWLLFFGISGVSSRLSKNNLKRGLILFGIALVTTAVTYAFFNGRSTIVFGVLHFLSLAIIIFHFIKPLFNKINPIVGSVVSLALFAFTYEIYKGYVGIFDFVQYRLPRALYSSKYLFWLGFPKLGFRSADYFPLIPFIFLFFIGCFLGKYVKDGKLPKFAYKKRCGFLSFMGRRALIIYLAHQPIIYAVCYLVKWIFF